MSNPNLNNRQFSLVEHAAPYDEGYRQLTAYSPGARPDEENDLEEHQVGFLSYKEHADHVEIGGRRTHEDYRHQGIATQLQDALERRTSKPVRSTDEGISDDAIQFHRAYRQRHPQSRWTLDVDG